MKFKRNGGSLNYPKGKAGGWRKKRTSHCHVTTSPVIQRPDSRTKRGTSVGPESPTLDVLDCEEYARESTSLTGHWQGKGAKPGAPKGPSKGRFLADSADSV